MDLLSRELVNFSFRSFESMCGSGCAGGMFVSDLQRHSFESRQLLLPESGDGLPQDNVCICVLHC